MPEESTGRGQEESMARSRRRERDARLRDMRSSEDVPWTPPVDGSPRARLEQERRSKRLAKQERRGRPSANYGLPLPGDDKEDAAEPIRQQVIPPSDDGDPIPDNLTQQERHRTGEDESRHSNDSHRVEERDEYWDYGDEDQSQDDFLEQAWGIPDDDAEAPEQDLVEEDDDDIEFDLLVRAIEAIAQNDDLEFEDLESVSDLANEYLSDMEEPASDSSDGHDDSPIPAEEAASRPSSAKPRQRLRPKPKPKPEPRQKPKPEAEPEPQPEQEPGPEPAPESEPEPNPQPDQEPDSQPKPEPRPKPEPEHKPRLQLRLRKSPEPGHEPEPEPELGLAPDSEPDTDLSQDPNNKLNSESEPDSEENPGTGLEQEPGSDPETDQESEPESEPHPKAEREHDPKPGQDKGPGSNPTPNGRKRRYFMHLAISDGDEYNSQEPPAASHRYIRIHDQERPMHIRSSQPRPKADASRDDAKMPEGYASREEYEEEQYIKNAFKEFKKKRRRRKLKKLIGTVVFLGLVGGGGFYYWTTQMQAPTEETLPVENLDSEVMTTPVRVGTLNSSVKAEGATAPLSSSGIESQFSGTILQVMVSEGDIVQKGDVLFTVTNESYYTKVKEAEARVQEANAALGEAQKSFQESYKTYENAYGAAQATDDWDSFDDSLEEGARQSYEDVKKAQQTLDAAKAAHDKLVAASAQESVKSVQAPISGNITKMKATVGTKIEASSTDKPSEESSTGSANDSLINIVDISQMIVTVQVNEVDIAKIQSGQQAKLTFSALPGVESMGTVQKVANVASGYDEGSYDVDPASRGVVTYAVTILIPAPDPQLKMGMTATAEIQTSGNEQHAIVPEDAIQEDENGTFVTVMGDKGAMRNVPVKVLGIESSEAAVEGEVKEGDLVVSTGGGLPEDAGDEYADEELPDEMYDDGVEE